MSWTRIALMFSPLREPRRTLVVEEDGFARIRDSQVCASVQVHPVEYLGTHHQTIRTKSKLL